MGNVAIVAIPSRDEPVWRISSQKVPHLTLLNLGENAANLPKIESFVDHVVKTSMHRFGLSVDRRDTLGDKNADVLMFSKAHTVRELETIRSYFLADDAIHKAFNTAKQFPEWIPHLTLGFPETPAKPDTRDYPGLSWVNFDTIALWTGDFEGPEFPLKDNLSWEVSMSDNVDDILAHFGVKGMKWGTRRAAKAARVTATRSEDSKNAVDAISKGKTVGVHSLSNKQLQDAVTRINLERQYNTVVPQPLGRKIIKGGAKIAGEILLGVGKQQVTRVANDQASKAIGEVLKK